MAEVGAVYDTTPVQRRPADILPGNDTQRRDASPGPAARNKWLTASVVDDAATVVSQIFDEATRRDPEHARAWVALVDGNNHQIDRIQAEAHARKVAVPIIIDFVHVLEYLWKAAWSFHPEGDPAAEAWVRRHAQTVLAGGATRVAGTLRRAATRAGLEPGRRASSDTCAKYLANKRAYLDYPTALKQGWPIATGIIEGACRHLVKRPDGPHRRPLGTPRCRSSSQTAGTTLQRRLRHLLALPPRPRTTTHPPIPLRRQHRSEGRLSLQESHTRYLWHPDIGVGAGEAEWSAPVVTALLRVRSGVCSGSPQGSAKPAAQPLERQCPSH